MEDFKPEAIFGGRLAREMCHQGTENWVQGKNFLIPNTVYPISHPDIQLTLLFFPFGEFLLALQQNAKVENDWCETRPK